MQLDRRASGAHLYLLAMAALTNRIMAQDNSVFPSPPVSSTSYPDTFRTGKLNQFQGFFTPKPYPDNASFTYASIWASWSAWSFCSNNIQIRVRACNTIRGFTCPGANQERRSCGEPSNRVNQFDESSRLNHRRFGGDYDAVDPWEEDRKEALKQLYSNYTVPDNASTSQSAPSLLNIQHPVVPVKVHNENEFSAIAQSNGRTALGYGRGQPIGPPIERYGRKLHTDGASKAPSMTPELLFGSKLNVPTKLLKLPKLNSIDSKKNGINTKQELQDIDIGSHSSESTEVSKHQTFNKAEVQSVVSTVDATGSPLKIVPTASFSAEEKTPTDQFPENNLEITSIDPVNLQSKEPVVPAVIVEKLRNNVSNSTSTQLNPAPSVVQLSNLEVITELDSEQTSHHASVNIVQPSKTIQTTSLNKLKNRQIAIKPMQSIDGPTEVWNSSEIYEDEFEQKQKVVKLIPQPELKQSSGKVFDLKGHDDITAIEKDAQIKNNRHNDEIIYSKDTINGLEWLLANMTKAAQQSQQRLIAESEKAKFFPAEQKFKAINAFLDNEQKNKTHLHSGEVNFGTSENSGEFDGFTKVNTGIHRVHATKTQQELIEEKPVTIKGILPSLKKTNGADYQKTKIIKPAQYQLRPDIETLRLETELRRLQSDVEKLESDLATIQTDNSDANQVFTTQRPYATLLPIEIMTVPTLATTISKQKAKEKAMDLELVPKTPPNSGYMESVKISALPSIINTENGGLFVLDGPQKAWEAFWSEWREWGECFCDRQVRTRICNYDNAFHSKGCYGKSFESRSCQTTRSCPAKLAATRQTSTTSPIKANTDSDGIFTVSPPRSRTGYAFQPNPLSKAISSIR